MALIKEGAFSSVAIFLVSWIAAYSSFQDF
jgi:hypothetical protein